jgi:hypothetical protein
MADVVSRRVPLKTLKASGARTFIVCDCAATNLMKQNRSEPLYPAAFLKMLSRMCTSLHVASSDCQSSGGFPFFSIAAKTA